MRESWMQRLDLPDEPMPNQTLVEIADCSRVVIEHHHGVTQYGTTRICVKVKFGCVAISGKSLKLVRMTSEQVIISGQIRCVELERVGNR